MSVLSSTLFTGYFTDDHYDEMFQPNMSIQHAWKSLYDTILQLGSKRLESGQNEINWYLTENGVTYNVYNDPQGLNRPWHLNAMPHILHEREWATVEKGIQQRAELLNLILADVYGKRALISNGIIPQEVIYGHRGFIRACDQITYNTQKHLLIYGADMARGPDGQMWVISDRTQAPSGMGYALENRMTMERVLPDLSNNIHVKRLSGFFQQFNDLLVQSCPGKKENPGIVVLTPGPHNETYFEHAYLASFLGYPLVQGNDLVVRNGYLWLKSLKGLKQVDVVLRRVDDMYSDPLELREDSQLGIAGLLEVVRRKNVSIINPIGSRLLENPGLNPFLNNAAKYFFNESLILPQIASWWCGQELERKYVLENLDKLIVKRIDRATLNSMFLGYKMSKTELDDLRKMILDRPYRFVAQEKVGFSTTPTFVNGHFEPRNSVLRSFAIAHKNNYSIMPGGLVRVASERGNIQVSNQKGGSSKDTWIVSDQKELTPPVFLRSPNTKATSGFKDLPSLTAENLYWVGRYVSRTLMVARYMRMVVKQLNYVQCNSRRPNSQSLDILLMGVTHLTGTYPGFVGDDQHTPPCDAFSEIRAVLFDKQRPGSLAFTLSMFNNAYFSILNHCSTDMVRIFERIQKIWNDLANSKDPTPKNISSALDQIITRLLAFMGLVEESILMSQGLILYYIGLQLEQSQLSISKCRALLAAKQTELAEYELLEALLTSNESLNIYRNTYRSFIKFENVAGLLLLDLTYPRSLAYHLQRLYKDVSELPYTATSSDMAEHVKYFFEAYTKIRLMNVETLAQVEEDSMIREKMALLLSDISNLLYNGSLVLSNTYFSHTYTQNQLIRQRFEI